MIIAKTMNKSYFVRFHENSELSKNIEKHGILLQLMPHNEYYIAEYISKENYKEEVGYEPR